LLAADAVHLLADDLLDPAHNAPADGPVAVVPAGALWAGPGAEHELVVRRLGVGRGVTQRLAEELGHPHGWSLVAGRCFAGRRILAEHLRTRACATRPVVRRPHALGQVSHRRRRTPDAPCGPRGARRTACRCSIEWRVGRWGRR